jgi:hypothetical protein
MRKPTIGVRYDLQSVQMWGFELLLYVVVGGEELGEVFRLNFQLCQPSLPRALVNESALTLLNQSSNNL